MQHQTSPTPPPLIENFKMMPISTITDVTSSSVDVSYPSLLLKKKLAMLENPPATTTTSEVNEPISPPLALIKPSSTTLSVNENEPVKSASRRRKPLRPWSLSARGERPNTTIPPNNGISQMIEPISDNDDDHHSTEMNHSPVNNNDTTNSNPEHDNDDDDDDDDDEDLHNNEKEMTENDLNDDNWPKHLSTIEEILKLYRVESNGSVQCARCGCSANQDNLLEHVSVHYPYKCYSCGFYCDSSTGLDEHNRTHSPNALLKSVPQTVVPLPPPPPPPVPPVTKSSESVNGSNSEKSTPPAKAKLHRCRQCPFVSNVKEDYWAHHRVHIRADKILECPSCPFVTEYKHHLEYHLRNHLGSKPFKCSKCEYACVNLSMLRSHKKSHFRHLLFKCSNCSFESKQYQALQEHLQTEGHEPFVDNNIEEFLKEYSSGGMTHTNTNNNSNSSMPPTLVPTTPQQSNSTKNNSRQPASKKRKTAPAAAPLVVKRASSSSSVGSSTAAISPVSMDEQHNHHQTDMINHQMTPSTPSSAPLVCTLCDYVAASKEGLGVHLFQHACKKSDLLNRSLLTTPTLDPTAKLMELFNGKIGPFTSGSSGSSGQLSDLIAPYQQFLTQQLQSHLSPATSSLSTNFDSSPGTNSVHHYHLDNNNNHAPPPPSLLSGGYSLLSSCIKSESNENHLPLKTTEQQIPKRQRKGQAPFKLRPTDGSLITDEHYNETITTNSIRTSHVVDQQTQVDEWQIKRLFECFHCEIIFKDFAMYCTHKQLHYSPDNPFRCAQCGEQKANKYDFFVHVAQQAHDLT